MKGSFMLYLHLKVILVFFHLKGKLFISNFMKKKTPLELKVSKHKRSRGVHAYRLNLISNLICMHHNFSILLYTCITSVYF